ncbi:Metallophosphoesterase domain-containing 1 [Brachionus plicatilis]|uniref:Metallophosphoesterase domain-containing 1 n=1 Tax=Brachionus plicatilis TaxID=10195 RepID=A0A3M7P9D7_BRAPC|nr:Metallophosphoesterase domain-containing 1 [Brachionus plicatilis]
MKISVHEFSNDPNRALKSFKLDKNPVQKLSLNTPIDQKKIRIVCISDTHTNVSTSMIPRADILIHAGDFLRIGSISEFNHFLDFLASLTHVQYKIIIAGNHDRFFDQKYYKKDFMKYVDQISKHCIYLQDRAIELFGLKIYGSPWQPVHCGNAFQLERGEQLLEKWNQIPDDTDILITHGPPLGFGDKIGVRHVGCVELLNTVVERVKPKLHVFGHIHEDHGIWTNGETCFINASICNREYRAVYDPILFDFDIPENKTKRDFIKQNLMENCLKDLKI